MQGLVSAKHWLVSAKQWLVSVACKCKAVACQCKAFFEPCSMQWIVSASQISCFIRAFFKRYLIQRFLIQAVHVCQFVVVCNLMILCITLCLISPSRVLSLSYLSTIRRIYFIFLLGGHPDRFAVLE